MERLKKISLGIFVVLLSMFLSCRTQKMYAIDSDRINPIYPFQNANANYAAGDFAQAVSNGHAIAGSLNGDNSWAERYFDERVTMRIRQVLRSAS